MSESGEWPANKETSRTGDGLGESFTPPTAAFPIRFPTQRSYAPSEPPVTPKMCLPLPLPKFSPWRGVCCFEPVCTTHCFLFDNKSVSRRRQQSPCSVKFFFLTRLTRSPLSIRYSLRVSSYCRYRTRSCAGRRWFFEAVCHAHRFRSHSQYSAYVGRIYFFKCTRKSEGAWSLTTSVLIVRH